MEVYELKIKFVSFIFHRIIIRYTCYSHVNVHVYALIEEEIECALIRRAVDKRSGRGPRVS